MIYKELIIQKFRILGAFLWLSVFLFSCNNVKKESSQVYLKVIDSYNREVILAEEPKRIVSLSPGITEMIFLLKGEDRLVGVSDFCNYPPEAAKIEKVGGLTDMSIEKLVSLKPDLVLIGSIIPKENVEKLEGMGIPVLAIREEMKIEGIYRALEELGKILNRPEQAGEQIALFKQKLAGIEVSNQQHAARSVYYVVGFGAAGDFTAPKNSHIHEIITLAGGRNMGENLTSWNISREYLFRENPDIILVRKEDLQQFCKTSPYNRLKAVKENRVYPIESGWIDVVSPRNIQAVEYISEKIEQY